MSKKASQFPFYINPFDVDDDCFWIIDVYGFAEGNRFVKLIDKQFIDRINHPEKYKLNADELLLEIRQCLVDNGFEEEVAACDKASAMGKSDRGTVNLCIPTHKRWEMDNAR